MHRWPDLRPGNPAGAEMSADPFDKARDEVDRDYDEGQIDGAEANRLMREIADDEDEYWRDRR